MKDSTRTAIEGIDFYLRNPEPPTVYTRFLRWADNVAGWRDARTLSTPQAAELTSEGSLPELTAWAHATLALAAQVEAKERIVHEGAVDPARREMTRLTHIAAQAHTAHTAALDATAATEAAGPESSAPSTPAEAYDSDSVRSTRRDAAHQGVLASHRGRAKAAEAAAAEAETDLDVLTTRIEGADRALAHRLAEHTHYTRRRLATYARAIARRHPDAALVSALTTDLATPTNTDPEPPAPTPLFAL